MQKDVKKVPKILKKNLKVGEKKGFQVWLQMALNCFKWLEMNPNGFKWVLMTRNGLKWLEFGS